MNIKDKAGHVDSTVPNERVLRIFAKISDPKNAHLFTAEVARKAFMHVKLTSPEATKAPPVRKALNAAAQLMKQREDRIANIVIWGFGACNADCVFCRRSRYQFHEMTAVHFNILENTFYAVIQRHVN